MKKKSILVAVRDHSKHMLYSKNSKEKYQDCNFYLKLLTPTPDNILCHHRALLYFCSIFSMHTQIWKGQIFGVGYGFFSFLCWLLFVCFFALMVACYLRVTEGINQLILGGVTIRRGLFCFLVPGRFWENLTLITNSEFIYFLCL